AEVGRKLGRVDAGRARARPQRLDRDRADPVGAVQLGGLARDHLVGHEGGDAARELGLLGGRLEGDHARIVSRTAAAIAAASGSAWARSAPLGTGTGAAPTRRGAASRSSSACSTTAATTSAPTPPSTQASWAVTSRPVRRTDST